MPTTDAIAAASCKKLLISIGGAERPLERLEADILEHQHRVPAAPSPAEDALAILPQNQTTAILIAVRGYPGSQNPEIAVLARPLQREMAFCGGVLDLKSGAVMNDLKAILVVIVVCILLYLALGVKDALRWTYDLDR